MALISSQSRTYLRLIAYGNRGRGVYQFSLLPVLIYINIFDMVRRVQVDEIISEVSKTGTGGHAFVPKAWIGNRSKLLY
jgi:hypothetical protein